MRGIVCVALVLLLTGCWCAPDKGDTSAGSDTMGYMKDCWAYAKGQKK